MVGKPKKEEDDRYVMMRAEDRSIWVRSSFILEKYKVLVWIIAGVLLAFGFQFKTPAKIVEELQGQITLNKRQVDSTITPKVNRLEDKLDILLRLSCTNKSITTEQKDLAGLNCNEVLRGR